MCGIFSIFSFSSIDNLKEVLEESINVLHHRGPDSNGFVVGEQGRYGLAHTRLAIIDYDSKSNQPLLSSDGRFELIFNGEIYNYIELREECTKLGSKFETNGDSEVIIEVYRHFKADIEQKLRGMWAFVLVDKKEDQVIVSRDYLGIKPLYYGSKNGKLIFASEVKVFHALHTDFIIEDDKTVHLFERFSKVENGNWTFYKNIKRFPAGHTLTFRLSSPPTSLADLVFKQFLKVNFETKSLSSKDLRGVMEDSMLLHLRSDAPVGINLSGGIDSSALTMLANELQSTEEISTFTTQFKAHQDIDETQFAREVSQKVKAKANYVSPTFSDFKDEVGRVLHFHDEPFGSTSIFSHYSIYKSISNFNIKVVLSGQGADELFFGYPGYFSSFLAHKLKDLKFVDFFKYRAFFSKKYGYKFASIKALRKLLKNWLSPSFSEDFYYKHSAEDTLKNRIKYVQKKSHTFEDYLKKNILDENLPSLLRYEDRNSMAFSIESRVPFVDREVLSYATKVSTDLKIKDGITKYILRESVKDLLPDSIYTRLDKLGFPAPERDWVGRLMKTKVSGLNSKAWKVYILKEWRKLNKNRREKKAILV